jgi:hypothetical protein
VLATTSGCNGRSARNPRHRAIGIPRGDPARPANDPCRPPTGGCAPGFHCHRTLTSDNKPIAQCCPHDRPQFFSSGLPGDPGACCGYGDVYNETKSGCASACPSFPRLCPETGRKHCCPAPAVFDVVTCKCLSPCVGSSGGGCQANQECAANIGGFNVFAVPRGRPAAVHALIAYRRAKDAVAPDRNSIPQAPIQDNT